MAVLAGVLAPVAIRQLDRIAAEQEMARLQALEDALKRSILATRSIPSLTNWATVVASHAGLDIGAVTDNIRRRPRVFLVDGGGWLSNSLPYFQTAQGTSVLPANARAMFVSSLGGSLPIGSGIASAADFAALWNVAPRTVPGTGAWAGWTGDAGDVQIHRVNLSPLFIKLVLSSYNSATNGQYAVDGSATNQVPFGAGLGGYFFKGSLLKLYRGAPESLFDSTQVLNDDASFVYESGMWKSSLRGTISTGVADTAGVVAAFLAATPNTNAYYKATNYQQILVVTKMAEYISNYNAWAEGNFASDPLRTQLIAVQADMMTAVWGLFSQFGGKNYYPTNGTPPP